MSTTGVAAAPQTPYTTYSVTWSRIWLKSLFRCQMNYVPYIDQKVENRSALIESKSAAMAAATRR